jgi:hypothetical protein
LKKVLLVTLITFSLVYSQSKTSKISSDAGAFSRMGFGARGMGMGNAVSSVTEGNVVSYYNPALSVFQEGNFFQASYSFLSFDRTLNFINFTRKFQFKSSDTSSRKFIPVAGLSAGIINAGVSKIDGRDNQGIKTGDLSTSENQFFLSFANRFSKKLAIGIAAKFYYYRLYDKITSGGFGLDIGLLYMLNQNFNISLILADINSKYKWDTSPIYDTEGNTTENQFPILKKIGLSYRFDNPKIIAAVEFENSNAGTNYIRFGGEYNIYEQLYLRAGLDKWNLSNADFPARPSFGFSYFKEIDKVIFGVEYAFVIEPYSSSDQHIVGLNINF